MSEAGSGQKASASPSENPLPPPNPDRGTAASEPPSEPLGGSMSLLDHLAELRGVLVSSLIAAGVAMGGLWFASASLLDLLVAPLRAAGHKVFFHAPSEAFVARLKLSAVCGLFLVLPYVLSRIYGFVLPGLYRRERRVVTPLLISATLLFYAGVLFAFLVIVPQVVRFMLGFGTEFLQPLIGVGPYFAFVAQFCLAFGLVFQLPLVVLGLSLAGIVSPRLLLRGWRVALLVIVTVSAILTPPDIVSQLAMAVPVMILYLLSVAVALVIARRQRRSQKRGDED